MVNAAFVPRDQSVCDTCLTDRGHFSPFVFFFSLQKSTTHRFGSCKIANFC